MSIFALEEIPYQNWLTTKNSVEKINALSNEMYLKILNFFNEKLNLKYSHYIPWMLSSAKDENFLPLVNYSSHSKIMSSIQYIELLNSTFSKFSGDLKFESYLGVKFNELNVETDANIIQDFSAQFNKAIDILTQACPWIKEMYDLLVHQVIFLKSAESGLKAMSSSFVKGTIIFRVLSNNKFGDLIDLSVDIAHEVGHQALMVFLTSNKIISSSYDTPVYSGARKINRLAIQSLHSAVAVTYMLCILEGILNNFSDLEKNLKNNILNKKLDLELNLKINLESLLDNCEFTEFGRLVMRELTRNYSLTNSIKGN